MKTNIKKITFLALLLIIFQYTYAQSNYVPGLIINNQNDTIQGQIDYRAWAKNPDEISFKKANGTIQRYSSLEISEFQVKEDRYVSGLIEIELSPSKIGSLVEDPNLRIKKVQTFVQTIFQGKKSLYLYTDLEGKENFYIKNGDKLDLLVYKKYLKEDKGNLLVAQNKKYRGQLLLYLNDCLSIEKKLLNIEYSQRSLVELFKNYYSCSYSPLLYKHKNNKLLTEFGVLAGMSISSLEFKSEILPHIVEADYQVSTNFVPGIFVNLVLPRNQGKWSLYNDLLFARYAIDGYYEDIHNEEYFSIYNLDFDYVYIKINNLLRYQYPIGKFQVFANAGMSNGFGLGANTVTEQKMFYTMETLEKSNALQYTRSLEQSYILGLGFKYNDRFSLEARYEKGNGMSDYVAVNSLTQRYFLLLGYTFFSNQKKATLN